MPFYLSPAAELVIHLSGKYFLNYYNYNLLIAYCAPFFPPLFLTTRGSFLFHRFGQCSSEKEHDSLSFPETMSTQGALASFKACSDSTTHPASPSKTKQPLSIPRCGTKSAL